VETRRNAPRVLAQFLRSALHELRTAGVPRADTQGAREVFDNGIQVVESVAEELEQIAAAPDPADSPSSDSAEVTNA
jgi:hypothetical protein